MKKIIPILIFAFFISCGKIAKESKNDTFDVLKVNPQKKSIELNSLFKTFDVLQLKGAPLIPVISSLFLTDSLVIVGDVYKTESIYFFDLDGNYKYKWDKSQNRFFYLNEGIRDFKIDKSRGELSILSKSGTKLHRFDFNGNLISSKKLGFKSYSFSIDSLGCYYFDLSNEIQEGRSYNIARFDIENNKITKLKPTPEEVLNLTLTSDKTLRSNGDGVLYFPCLEHAIFEVKKDTFLLKYKLDYGNNSLSKEFLSSIHDSPPLMQALDAEKFAVFPRIFKSSSEIMINTQVGSFFKGFKNFLMVSLKNNSMINFSSLTIDSNNIAFDFVGNTDKHFILAVNAEQAKLNDYKSKEYQGLYNLLKNEKNLNPIILIGKVKWD